MKNDATRLMLCFALICNTLLTFAQTNTMDSQTIETRVGNIEYTLEGTGKTILIIHGGNENCFVDIKQKHLIDAAYQVLIPSRPGYGNTSIAFGRTAPEQADFLKTLLDSLDIQKVSVIASSAGGPVGLEFAKKYPDYTSCLILEEAITKTWVSKLSPVYYVMKYLMHPKRQARLWEKQREEFAINRAKHLKKLSKRFSTQKPEFVLGEWDEHDISFYGEMLSQLNSGSGFFYNIDHKATAIDLIAVPTLIIHSPFDKNVPFKHALYAHKEIRDSQLYIAPATSHLIYMGKDYNYILDKRLSFIRETSSPQPAQ
jgi:pimeloyl-ACP methyl ester carboxylesterase